jgi:murein DD-endopeptidase MepM/ murein hydrolase activator NlpD
LQHIGASARTFVATTALIAGVTAAPVAWFLLNEVSADTMSASAADSADPAVTSESTETAGTALESGHLPTMAGSGDPNSAPGAVTLDDAATPDAANPAETPRHLRPLPTDIVVALEAAQVPAENAGDGDLTALREPDSAYSINLGTMRLDSDPDAASLNAYGLTIEEARQIVEVKPGDTLIELLVDAGATQADAYAAVTALEPAFSPRELKPGQSIALTFAAAQPDALMENASFQLVGLQIAPNAERDVQVNRSFDGLFTVMEIEHPLQQTSVRGAGTIDSSLYQAAVDAGVSLTALTEMIRAFSFDVDFQREIQPGDAFEIVYDLYLDENGEVVKTGDVVYASMTLSGETIELYRYTPSSGIWDFFNPNGESVRKALMRTPIDGARLTSSFGLRTHPTLGYTKMHRGVDFGAATGTPIYAAGDGTIDRIGANGGYGNYIRIRHNSEFSTAYAHMSAFAKGLHKGDRVRQGDIIGYVGTTGRSTGPHLHYEVMINGEQVNPLDVKLPAGEKLAGADLEGFFASRNQIVALRDTLRRGELIFARSQGTCYAVTEEKGC